jgi:hypothetical protein
MNFSSAITFQVRRLPQIFFISLLLANLAFSQQVEQNDESTSPTPSRMQGSSKHVAGRVLLIVDPAVNEFESERAIRAVGGRVVEGDPRIGLRVVELAPGASEEARPYNNEMKLTKPRTSRRGVALKLISVLGRPWGTLVKSACAVLLSLGLVACDTMISDRIRIGAPLTAAGSTPTPSQAELLNFVRDTLAASDLTRRPDAPDETWEWRDPDHPPGLHATIEPGVGYVLVRMSQGLYGPIGETEKYRRVKEALLGGATRRFGRKNVRVE